MGVGIVIVWPPDAEGSERAEATSMRLVAHGVTDVGRKRRHNEDALLCAPERGLFVVADGLGGHASGEVASQEAVETILSWLIREDAVIQQLHRTPDNPRALAAARRTVENAVKGATYHIFSMAEQDTAKSGMGTTISLLLVVDHIGLVAQVGDSRIYRMRQGVVEQLTDDHTLVAMQVRDGLLTAEEATRVPHRNVITRAVGSHDYVEVDTLATEVLPGDTFLLCTDGLHGYLDVEELPMFLTEPPELAAPMLVDLANQRGGKDNITAVVVNVERT